MEAPREAHDLLLFNHEGGGGGISSGTQARWPDLGAKARDVGSGRREGLLVMGCGHLSDAKRLKGAGRCGVSRTGTADEKSTSWVLLRLKAARPSVGPGVDILPAAFQSPLALRPRDLHPVRARCPRLLLRCSVTNDGALQLLGGRSGNPALPVSSSQERWRSIAVALAGGRVISAGQRRVPSADGSRPQNRSSPDKQEHCYSTRTRYLYEISSAMYQVPGTVPLPGTVKSPP